MPQLLEIEVLPMEHDQFWPPLWMTYPELPGYQVQINIDALSGRVTGFLVAISGESDPEDQHIHYCFDPHTERTIYYRRQGEKTWLKKFSSLAIEAIKTKLPLLLLA